MSHIEVSEIIIEEVNNTIPSIEIPNIDIGIDFVDIALVFAIIVCFTKFIKSLKT